MISVYGVGAGSTSRDSRRARPREPTTANCIVDHRHQVGACLRVVPACPSLPSSDLSWRTPGTPWCSSTSTGRWRRSSTTRRGPDLSLPPVTRWRGWCPLRRPGGGGERPTGRVPGRRAWRSTALVYAGLYGLERLVDGEVVVDPRAEPVARRDGPGRATTPTPRCPACSWSTRAGSRSPSTGATRRRSQRRRRRWAAGLARRYDLDAPLRGRMAVELRPPVPVDKGTVTAELVTGASVARVRRRRRGDLPAFDVLTRLAESGAVAHTVRIGVRSEEAPPEIFAADVLVDGPAGLAARARRRSPTEISARGGEPPRARCGACASTASSRSRVARVARARRRASTARGVQRVGGLFDVVRVHRERCLVRAPRTRPPPVRGRPRRRAGSPAGLPSRRG